MTDMNLHPMASDNYDDIISLPHHTSKTHQRMSAAMRAAQFAPFAALTGHGEAIKQTAEDIMIYTNISMLLSSDDEY